ncbi:hypothetical protein [Pseudomonas syringae]|uniref:hypothetical protein n=1 Tax=Pseudomonas syringae TaxID=317 RepID=UPI003F8395E5
MILELDLNRNDRNALLHHCQSFVPSSGDARKNRRLDHARLALAEALECADHLRIQD